MSPDLDGERFFVVGWGEIELRHDPNFYRATYRQLTAKIERQRHQSLGSLTRFSNESWDQQSGFAGSFPYLEISNIDLKTGEILALDEVPIEDAASRARMVSRTDDILVSTTRPSRGAITRVDPETAVPFIASTGFCVIRGVDESMASRDYLLLALRSAIGLRQMEQRSSGGNYPAITPTELKRVKIPIPSQADQSGHVSRYHLAVENYKRRLAQAAALLASIDDYLLSELGITLPPETENTLENRTFRVSAHELGGWRFDPPVHQSDFSLQSDRIVSMPLGKVCHVNPRTSFSGMDELRFILAGVSDISVSTLPWAEVRIDRTNRRWESLFELAKLFLKREWQRTDHDAKGGQGITLLFAMNDLFEAYIAALAKRALRNFGLTVVAQGGCIDCLKDERHGRGLFRTKPDILIKRGHDTVMVIDTKWKLIGRNPEERKRGVSQSDVYQMMAYARLYRCREVMLLYPHHVGLGPNALDDGYAMMEGNERLRIASVDLVADKGAVQQELAELIAPVVQAFGAIET